MNSFLTERRIRPYVRYGIGFQSTRSLISHTWKEADACKACKYWGFGELGDGRNSQCYPVLFIFNPAGVISELKFASFFCIVEIEVVGFWFI